MKSAALISQEAIADSKMNGRRNLIIGVHSRVGLHTGDAASLASRLKGINTYFHIIP
jgi:hypothetical protein